MKATVYTSAGKENGTIDLDKDIFGLKVDGGLLHRYLMFQRNNARVAVAHTKTRGERAGSTRKIYRQKGTGRARMGANRSPVRKGGGIVFGPRSERNFSEKMNKKERRKAIFTLLSDKAKAKSVAVIESVGQKKTKTFADAISKVATGTILLAVTAKETNARQVGGNLDFVKVIQVNYLNPKDLLKYNNVVFTKDAMAELKTIYA